MKKYIAPNVNVFEFTAQDVIATSNQSTYIEDRVDAINAIDMEGLLG